MKSLKRFMNDENGLTAIEYVIAASLLVGALTILFTGYGTALQAKITAIIATIT